LNRSEKRPILQTILAKTSQRYDEVDEVNVANRKSGVTIDTAEAARPRPSQHQDRQRSDGPRMPQLFCKHIEQRQRQQKGSDVDELTDVDIAFTSPCARKRRRGDQPGDERAAKCVDGA
jgi:hypothetical protein